MIVGVVQKPVGLDGGLKVKPVTDNPRRYAPGGRLWLDGADGGPVSFKITAVSEQKGALRLHLDGITSVEQAEAFRGRELYVPESEVPPLPEGQYYHFQIIGLDVYSHSGKLLGKVTDIFAAGEKDVYVVKGRGREYLIPVTDEHVRSIDPEAGRIDLHPMEGYIP